MATPFQHRLVGTVIVFAVGIIFLPDILDGNKEVYRENFATIPMKPELDEQKYFQADPDSLELAQAPNQPEQSWLDEPVEAAPIAAEPVAQVKAPEPEPKPEPVKTTTPPAEKPVQVAAKPKPQPKPEPQANLSKDAWIVQMGAFRNANSAERLAKKLRDAGYQAHVKPKVPVEGELNRVFVGPDVDKAKLEAAIPKLKALTDLTGRVIAFKASAG